MPVSKRKMFTALYRKEMREILPELIVVVTITVLLDAFVLFRYAGHNQGVILMPIFFTMGLAGFIPLLSSFKMLSTEWSTNTVYLIKSLPVSGAMVLGAKLLALFTQLIIGILVAGGIGTLMVLQALPEAMPALSAHPEAFTRAALVFAWLLIGFLLLCCASFLSQTLGRMTSKHSGMLTMVSFVVIMGLVNKIWGLIGSFIAPDSNPIISGFGRTFWNISTAYSLGTLLIAALLFVGAVWIYDRKLEL